MVQELGEEAFPEPEPEPTAAAAEPTTSVESQEPPSNEPSTAGTPSSSAESSTERKVVTTVERQPFVVPDTVHVRITPETLKDYVGPPVYQKDRMYVNPPPAGVSTGLGYLGNGSGSVMPVEAMVRLDPPRISIEIFLILSYRACRAKADCS